MARVPVSRVLRHCAAAVLLAAMLAAMPGIGLRAQASDYRFQTDYAVLFNGLPIGRATLSGSFDGSEYRLDGRGRLTGIVGALFDYTATGASAGRIRAGRPLPTAFSADASDGSEVQTVRMTLSGDRVNRMTIEPPLKPEEARHPGRVPITEAHKRGIIDPMSAMIGPGGFDGENFDRSICNRSVPIFNGRERFDVKLQYKGVQTVSSNRKDGYSGPVLVCAARYRPIAGHRADKEEVEYVANKVVVEVMLAPVPGSDLVVPFRASVSTRFGAGVVQATSMTSEGALRTKSASLAD